MISVKLSIKQYNPTLGKTAKTSHEASVIVFRVGEITSAREIMWCLIPFQISFDEAKFANINLIKIKRKKAKTPK